MERKLSYVKAIREATDQEMARDSSVVVFGLDVDDPKAIQGTTRGLQEKYGPERVFGTPLSEDGMTGIAIGMALAGLRPMHIHIRMDFLLLAMNQLINVAAKARYMYGGQVHVPVVVRAMIGKSWGQGAQHSQALYSFFMHVPGVKVVAPTTPYDAKGCLIHAIRDNDPVLYIEHRILHFQSGPVPEASYVVSPGKARVVTAGRDVTLVGISYMQVECIRAQRYLQSIGISAEVIDPDLVKPIGHRYGCSIRAEDGATVRGRQWLDDLRRQQRNYRSGARTSPRDQRYTGVSDGICPDDVPTHASSGKSFLSRRPKNSVDGLRSCRREKE